MEIKDYIRKDVEGIPYIAYETIVLELMTKINELEEEIELLKSQLLLPSTSEEFPL